MMVSGIPGTESLSTVCRYKRAASRNISPMMCFLLSIGDLVDLSPPDILGCGDEAIPAGASKPPAKDDADATNAGFLMSSSVDLPVALSLSSRSIASPRRMSSRMLRLPLWSSLDFQCASAEISAIASRASSGQPDNPSMRSSECCALDIGLMPVLAQKPAPPPKSRLYSDKKRGGCMSVMLAKMSQYWTDMGKSATVPIISAVRGDKATHHDRLRGEAACGGHVEERELGVFLLVDARLGEPFARILERRRPLGGAPAQQRVRDQLHGGDRVRVRVLARPVCLRRVHEVVQRAVVELPRDRVLRVGVVEDRLPAPRHLGAAVMERREGAERERDGAVGIRLDDLWIGRRARSAILSEGEIVRDVSQKQAIGGAACFDPPRRPTPLSPPMPCT